MAATVAILSLGASGISQDAFFCRMKTRSRHCWASSHSGRGLFIIFNSSMAASVVTMGHNFTVGTMLGWCSSDRLQVYLSWRTLCGDEHGCPQPFILLHTLLLLLFIVFHAHLESRGPQDMTEHRQTGWHWISWSILFVQHHTLKITYLVPLINVQKTLAINVYVRA